MNKKILKSILSQFDCVNVEYEPEDYISFSALGKANGSVRFNLIFDYSKSGNAVKSRELTIKNPQVAIKVFETLLWGRRAQESETNDFLETMLVGKDKEGKSGW